MSVQRTLRNLVIFAIPVCLAAAVESIGFAQSAARPGVLVTRDPAAWINIRTQPTVDSSAVQQGFGGDPIEVLREIRGADGFVWYYVRSPRSSAQGWVRGDLVSLTGAADRSLSSAPNPSAYHQADLPVPEVGGNPFPEYAPVPQNALPNSPNPFARSQPQPTEATAQPQTWMAPASGSTATVPQTLPVIPPTRSQELVFEQQPTPAPLRSSVAPTAPLVQPTPDPAWVPTPPSRHPGQPTGYTREQIQYFLEVAMGAEFGDTGGTIRKWSGPIRIQVNGTPTPEDLATLNAVVRELNELTEGITLEITDNTPNLEIFFAPESQFSRIEANYRPLNMGFFWTWWNGGQINRARILVSTTGITQRERSHLIREELTQSLGLMRDSNRYPDSIFYQGWTDVTQYTPLDRAIIAMLYRSDIRPGMNQAQVLATLNRGGDRAASTTACGLELPGGWRVALPWQNCNL